MGRWKSRKVIFSFIAMIANITIPMLFKKFEISEAVTLSSMGTISAVTAAYIYGNVKDAKIQADQSRVN